MLHMILQADLESWACAFILGPLAIICDDSLGEAVQIGEVKPHVYLTCNAHLSTQTNIPACAVVTAMSRPFYGLCVL